MVNTDKMFQPDWLKLLTQHGLFDMIGYIAYVFMVSIALAEKVYKPESLQEEILTTKQNKFNQVLF